MGYLGNPIYVGKVISDTFGVDMHRYEVGLLERPHVKERAHDIIVRRLRTIEHLMPKGMTIEKRAEYDLNHGAAFTVFTRDILEYFDYLVFMHQGMVGPLSLGEELSHGEHFCLHADPEAVNQYENYLNKFHRLSCEFVGDLGFSRMNEEVKKTDGSGFGIPQHMDVSNKDDLLNWIAHLAAQTLLSGVGEVPYRELFHAPDESSMWGIVSEALGKGRGIRVDLYAEDDTPPEGVVENLSEMIGQSKAKPITVGIIRNHGSDIIIGSS